MTVTTPSPEAEALVRDILYASGSSLDFFSMEKTRSKMFSAAQAHIDLSYKRGHAACDCGR
ncbi:MAG: hypothetical protein WCD70_15025 [Alphaproteobacteria bacterium]